MDFDVVLPIVVFAVAMISTFFYRKFQKKFNILFEDRKFSSRDAVLMVISMGIMVTVVAISPSRAVQILFIGVYSYMMFSFIYVAVQKWYLAVFPPVLFVLSYLLFWNPYTFNLFASLFAIMVTVYLGSLFSWKTTLVFAALLTMMDFFQVLVTGYMGEMANKMIDLGLPVLLILPTYPAAARIGLGLGDIFLSGLMVIQTASKRGQKAGLLTAVGIGIAMFVFEFTLFNVEHFEFFPATIVVMGGWALSMGILYLARSSFRSEPEKAEKFEEP